MSSYDELLKLAEENSREAQRLIQEKKKKRELHEARLKREKEKQEEISKFRQQKMMEMAMKARVEPQMGTKKPTPIPRNNDQKIKVEEKEKINGGSSSKNENQNKAKGQGQRNYGNGEKPPHLMTYEEILKYAEENNKPKPPTMPTKQTELDSPNSMRVKKKSSITNDNIRRDVIKRKTPNPIRSIPPQFAPTKMNSSRPSPIANGPKRITKSNDNSNTNIIAKKKTCVLTGSRFAKLGPIDNEMPTLNTKSKSGSSSNNISQSRNNFEINERKRATSSTTTVIKKKSSINQNENVVRSKIIGNEIRSRVVNNEIRPKIMNNELRPKVTNNEGARRVVSSEGKRKVNSEKSGTRRGFIDDDLLDEEYAKKNISSIIGSLFGYNRNKYRNDFSDDDMEVSASRLRAEESRSARIAREEDEMEEELERQRLERLKKKKSGKK
ncbi:hypothetical protein K502DRAFT_364440 [Neoconidiobolus thromboides FSU 785]|nr:hypothetical protein K502DRAFT_364440 [Neoconidiobolus thromboides FSU 785]